MSGDRADRFGDAHLAHVELLPLPVEERVLVGLPVAVLWLASAVGPGVYAFACGGAPLPRLAALALGLALVAGLAAAATRTAPRYGLAFAPLCRAALGARGSMLVVLVRVAAGALWLAAWAAPSGAWMALLALAGLGVEASGVWADAAGWGAASLLIALAWLCAFAGMAGIVRWARWGLIAAAVSAMALVVYGGIASSGFGDLGAGGAASWSWAGVSEAAAGVLGLTVVGVVSSSDWLRFVARTAPRRATLKSVAERLLSMAMLAAVALALVGALLAAASQVVRGRFDGHAVADAVGFAGLAGGSVGLLLLLSLWILSAPLVGLYSPALALCALAPRWLTYRRAVTLAALTALGLIPLWPLLAGAGAAEALTLLAAPFGVLVADELWRRGKVMLEEIYLTRSEYAPVAGVRIAGVLGVVAGWLVHPFAAPVLAGHAELASWVGALAKGGVATLAGFAIAAGVYLVLAPVDTLITWLRRRRQAPGDVQSDTATGVTSPHFVYDDRRPK